MEHKSLFLTAAKITKFCFKAVDNYPHALEFIFECYKTQKICEKSVDIHPTTIKYVLECYKTQEMCYEQFIDVFTI